MQSILRRAVVGLTLILVSSAVQAQEAGQGGEGITIDLRRERYATPEEFDERFEAVCRTPKLTVLHLQGSECTEKRVPFLSLARSLRELHIDRINGRIAPLLFRTLALMPRLTVIEMGLGVNPKELVGLRELAHLEYLTLHGFYDDGTAGPLFPPRLKRLTLMGASLTSTAWSNLADVPLESLILENVDLRDNVMRYLSTMTSLRRLDIPGSQFTPEAIEKLKRLKKLESLDISAPKAGSLDTTGVSHDVLKVLAETLPELWELKIRFVQLHDFTCLKGFEKLKVLDARGVTLPIQSAPFAEFVTNAKNLEVLYLIDSASDNDTALFDALRKAPKLKVLLVGQSISGSAWGTPDLLMRLDGHPTLEALRVLCFRQATNIIGDPGGVLRDFPNLPLLSFLYLEHSDIEETGLQAALKQPRLETLVLHNCKWQDGKGLGPFQDHATIKELSLRGTELEGRATEPLGTMKKLELLNLGSTKLTGDVLTTLQAVRTLRSLELDGCDLVDRDLRAFEDFAPLETLSLSHTTITDRAVESIARLTSLKDLSLEATAITKDCAGQLARLKQLRGLNVKGTGLSKSPQLFLLKNSLPGCEIDPYPYW